MRYPPAFADRSPRNCDVTHIVESDVLRRENRGAPLNQCHFRCQSVSLSKQCHARCSRIRCSETVPAISSNTRRIVRVAGEPHREQSLMPIRCHQRSQMRRLRQMAVPRPAPVVQERTTTNGQLEPHPEASSQGNDRKCMGSSEETSAFPKNHKQEAGCHLFCTEGN